MALTEGKNREIRRAWDTLGLLVTKLVRRRYGPATEMTVGRPVVLVCETQRMYLTAIVGSQLCWV